VPADEAAGAHDRGEVGQRTWKRRYGSPEVANVSWKIRASGNPLPQVRLGVGEAQWTLRVGWGHDEQASAHSPS
jgi:hypothetical protein